MLALRLFRLLWLGALLPLMAQTPGAISAKIAGCQRWEGLFPAYWDGAKGRIYLEVRPGQELLHLTTLTQGVGSNPIGLDRGQLGATRLVVFERRGPKVLLVERNTAFRAEGGSAEERLSVAQSFARSVLWGFKVEAEEGDRVLIDATPYVLSDAHGIAPQLRAAGQGEYSLDEERSAVDPEACRAFPRNTELEADLTFRTGQRPGPLVTQVTPSPEAVSVRVRHSFVALPEAGYAPRAFDSRVGALWMQAADYATPFTVPPERRWILRHRLLKKDPAAARSEVVKPIVYYLERGVPEPVRSALLEGASWWTEAFEAAGFRHAFEVRLLPEGADPMDVRYNVIQWVHRATRGWSLGSVVADPRTGEILKGTVTLGSLRVRQDFLIAAGLASPWADAYAPDPSAWAELAPGRLALARLRQLAAHEVGHTLGFDHNFAASSQARASVMDYPAPRVLIREGKLDFSEAYATGIGAFDRFALAYSYAQFAPGEAEGTALARLVAEGLAKGLRFVKDADAREPGTAHPFASVWDDGGDAVAQLRHEMEVRRLGLAQFGPQSQPEGEPLSWLEARLLPLYLHHRYQLEADVKLLGGVDFAYAVRAGAGSVPARARTPVPASRQREALQAALASLDPAFLAMPERLVSLIPPRAHGFEDGTAEYFPSRTGTGFDPLAAAEGGAELALNALLHPDRAARLVQQHAEAADLPGLAEVLGAVVRRTFSPSAKTPMEVAVGEVVQWSVLRHLETLAASPAPLVRAEAEDQLQSLAGRLGAPGPGIAHRRALRREIQRFLARALPAEKAPAAAAPPPGPPIGAD